MSNVKTDPMGLPPVARPLPSLRRTEPMGGALPRDTVRDPPEKLPDMEGLLPASVDPSILDGDAAAARTRELVAKSAESPSLSGALRTLQEAAREDQRRALPTSDRREAAEVVVGGARAPATSEQAGAPKVDVSRADPRRLPTRKITRKLDAPMLPDLSVRGGPAPAPPMEKTDRRALWLLVGLALLAAALGAAVLLRSRAPRASGEASGTEPARASDDATSTRVEGGEAVAPRAETPRRGRRARVAADGSVVEEAPEADGSSVIDPEAPPSPSSDLIFR